LADNDFDYCLYIGSDSVLLASWSGSQYDSQRFLDLALVLSDGDEESFQKGLDKTTRVMYISNASGFGS
jgi:hypothetical protein